MPTAQLIISQPGQKTRRIEVDKKLVSIGRKSDNTVPLEGDANVSKYHAVIESRADGFWVSDLGSSNGTTVNDQPVKTERKLLDGDLIGIGGASTVEFHVDGGPSAAPPPEDAPPKPKPPPPPGGAAADSAVTGAQAATAAAADAAPPPPEAQKPGGMSTTLIVGVVGGLLMLGALVAVLFGTGVLGSSGESKKSAAEKRREQAKEAARNEAGEEGGAGGGGESGRDAGNGGDSSATSADKSSGSQSAEEMAAALAGAQPPVAGGSTSSSAVAPANDEMGNMARTLAVQIAQKSSYNFDPAFIALIKNYVNEYRAAAGYYERARKYRDAVDREFVNVQGIQPPLIGYVAALSRSKFIEAGAQGVWGLPPSVTGASAQPVDMADPAASTRVAASYMKDLLDVFERENFMYAIACYGMTLDEAGRMKADLEQKDPGGQLRYDFWQMKNAGVVKGDQVERVARFFAAGIVGENPQRFGLKDRPLSSLY